MTVKNVLGDYILIETVTQDKTPGGILLPETMQSEELQCGAVVRYGPGYYQNGILVPLDVKCGDKVLYRASYSKALSFTKDGKKLLFVRHGDVVAII